MFKQFLLAGAAVMALASAAAAQPAQPMTRAPMMAPPGAGDPTAARPTERSMAGRIEQRITELHGKLQITREQQPQWQAFTTVMRENARSMDSTFQRRVQTMPNMSAVENMQSYAQVSAAHAADMQRVVPVFEALYATMSEQQRRVADRVFRDDAHRGPGKRS
eukprot:gene14595-19315_t